DQERRVAAEDPHVSLHTGRDHHLGGSRPHFALRRDEVNFDAHVDVDSICLACSTASSMLPTRKNACSGRLSYSPSQIPRNEAIVSSIGTYFPGMPVNCSATKNGCDRNF